MSNAVLSCGFLVGNLSRSTLTVQPLQDDKPTLIKTIIPLPNVY